MNMLKFVEKAGFEPRTLGTKAERYDHCASRPVITAYICYSLRPLWSVYPNKQVLLNIGFSEPLQNDH